MANIFQLAEMWRQIVDMSDQLDEQTLEDKLESIEGEMEDKVANVIAVIKSIKGEIEVAKEFEKSLDVRIKTMENTVERLNDYILAGVDTVGTPKEGAEQFKKLEIKEKPWVKSVWTQYNPPKVHVVDERLLSEEFLIPQPYKVDMESIADRWKSLVEGYEEKRAQFVESLENDLEKGEIDITAAENLLKGWEHQHRPEIPGVEVSQSIGVRYR